MTGKLVFYTLFLATIFYSCARELAPEGGPRDQKGPVLDTVTPPRGTLFFKGRDVRFHFDEFLKPGNYLPEIFISPVLPEPPTVTVQGKNLHIHFNEDLRPNTTYVIHLGKGIADFHEGNKLESAIVYAFSTGAVLDSMKLQGQVKNSTTGKGEKDITILLFNADSARADCVLNKRPLYASISQENGLFSLMAALSRNS